MAHYLSQPPSHERARAHVISDLARAQHALLEDPDLAALYVDGALQRIAAVIACHASEPGAQGQFLRELDRARPLLAMRFRLALRAPDVAAKLAHCWALIEALGSDAPISSNCQS